MSLPGKENHWQTFWEQNMLTPAMSAAIARGYWERLRGVIPVDRSWVGLDFGCGQGYLLRLMALSLKRMFGFDSSPTMVESSRKSSREYGNVSISRVTAPPKRGHNPHFDLIVVNSCIQYLNDQELKRWLRWWLGNLAAGGSLVLSDLFPAAGSRWSNFQETVCWGWREGCLGSVLHEFLLMLRYGYFREVHYGRQPEELLSLIDECGGQGYLLPRNLDFLSTRYSVIARIGSIGF